MPVPRDRNRPDRVPFLAAYVSSLERSVRFYESVLGLEPCDFPLTGGLGKARAFAIQGTTLVLIEPEAAAPPPRGSGPDPGTGYFSFAVPDLAAYHEKLRARGTTVVSEPARQPFGKFAVYRDPDGLLFSVIEVDREPERQAIVFSGGGALAAFEVGVALALSARGGAVPTILTGTSAGAYNAAFLASRSKAGFADAVKELESIWLERVAGPLHANGVVRIRGNPEVFFDPSYLLSHPFRPFAQMMSDAAYLGGRGLIRFDNLLRGKEPVPRRLAELVDVSDYITSEPLGELVRETIPVEALLASETRLRIVATNWSTGQPRVFFHGAGDEFRAGRDLLLSASNAASAIMASAAIPALFQPVEVGAEKLVDGGVVMNTPLEPAISAGATVIHLISVDPDPRDLDAGGLRDSLEEVERTLVAAVAANIRNDLKMARLLNSIAGVARNPRTGKLYRGIEVHRYHPSPRHIGGLTGLLDFSRSHVESLIAEGRERAQNHACHSAGCVRLPLPA